MANSSFCSSVEHQIDSTALDASWRSGPDTRGSYNILSSCLCTIFIAVWSAYYPNIPTTPPQDRDALDELLKSIGMMLVFLLVPEALVIMAARELYKARKLQTYINNQLHLCHPKWTLTHGFYALMGGFAIHRDGATKFLDTSGLERIARTTPERLSAVDKKSIEAWAHRDSLSKGITVLQILSFFYTFVLRFISGLTLSTLERSTALYALCAIIVYALWWKKPHTIKDTPTILEIDDKEVEEDLTFTCRDDFVQIFFEDLECAGFCGTLLIVSGAMLYGLAHRFAQGPDFPSNTERFLWNLSITIITLSIPALVFLYLVERHFLPPSWNGNRTWHQNQDDLSLSDWLFFWLEFLVAMFYITAKMYLLVEACRQLLYLPCDAFSVPSYNQYSKRDSVFM